MDDPVETLKFRLEESIKLGIDAENVGRHIVIHAVDATHRYLSDIGIEDRLRAPLLHLLGALQDLEDGRTSPLLSPGPYQLPKQAIRQMDIAEFAMAAAAVTIMAREPGVSTEQALSKMARVIGAEKEKLREFRKNIRKGRANAVAIREHDEWIKLRARFKELSDAGFVETMIDKAKMLSLKKG